MKVEPDFWGCNKKRVVRIGYYNEGGGFVEIEGAPHVDLKEAELSIEESEQAIKLAAEWQVIMDIRTQSERARVTPATPTKRGVVAHAEPARS